MCVCVCFLKQCFLLKTKVIKNGGFVWGDETNTFQMSDINVEVEKGSLVMVLGGKIKKRIIVSGRQKQ